MIHFNHHNEASGTLELQKIQTGTVARKQDVPMPANGHDPVVIKAATTFLDEGTLADGSKPSRAWLARAIGLSTAVISQWLDSKYPGDALRVSRLVADALKTIGMRMPRSAQIIYANEVTEEVGAVFEHTIKHGAVNVLIGEPGIGKTCGKELYLRDHPTAVSATLYSRTDGNESGVYRMLMRAIDTSRYSTKHGQTRAEFLREHFHGSERLLLFDNGEFLTLGGLRTIIFFNEATGVPVCIIGTPELMARIRQHPKLLTRLYQNPIIPFDQHKSAALKELNAKCAEHAAELLPLALQVVKNKGALRALSQQLRLALWLFESRKFRTISVAFKAAHTQLVRDYKLTEPND